jgi:hypothetical protein
MRNVPFFTAHSNDDKDLSYDEKAKTAQRRHLFASLCKN